MKVALYKDTFANNRGADAAVKNLAAGLSERGHEVVLFDKPQFAAKVQGRYDVLISAGTNEILDLAASWPRCPVVQQFHTDPAYPFRHWLRRWRRNRAIRAALSRADAFHVLSHGYADKLRGILGDRNAKIEAIGNWSPFEPVAGRRPSGEKMILCPGAINRDKNQSLLVDAFASIAADFPEWKVHIYGKGSAKEENSLRRRIERRSLSGKVELMGYGDLAGPYAQCAFVAFPSKTEGIPLSLVDAAMFGKSSVTIHDWIGCSHAVSSGEFAGAMRRFMSDARLRREAGENARRHCLENFSREKILDRWEKLLAEVAGR